MKQKMLRLFFHNNMVGTFLPEPLHQLTHIGSLVSFANIENSISGRYAGVIMASLNSKRGDNISKGSEKITNGHVNFVSNHLDCNNSSSPAMTEEAKKKQDEGFLMEDHKHRDEILTRMNTMRKEGNLCDAILEIKGQSIFVHRVVLASSSTFFFEVFSLSEERSKRVDTKESFVLDDLDYNSVERIVNYFYTSKLTCDFKDVSLLYKTAMKLKVHRLAERCSKYLIQCLTPQNCLGTYEFVSYLEGKECMREVGRYIQNNIFTIMENSSEFSGLPCIVVDILGQVSPDFNLTEQPLCRLVVSWLQEQNVDKTTDEQLRFFLFLNPDNKLIDCIEELPDAKLNNSNIVKDYKKKCSKKPSLKDKRNSLQHQRQNSSPGNKSPQPPHLSEDEDDASTSMVASAVVADKSFICIAVLNKHLVSISIKFQSDENVRKMSSGEDDNTSDELVMTVDRNQPQCLMTHLSPMSTSRCGFGVGVVNGLIIALGGYDRGECFNTVESYSPITNAWTPLKPMNTLRGRFAAGLLGNRLYACGGSNGTNELNSVEAYDVVSDVWVSVPDMAVKRSGAGVAVCNNKLYVVGGLCGSKTLSSCEMYDPIVNKWTKVANLNTGRSQAAVCSYNNNDSIVALGGCDAWNFMNTCECYDPISDKWTFLPPLVVARRGAGAAYFKGMLFVMGGINEQMTLMSVEIFDPENSCWFSGPNLGVPRANMGVGVLDSNRLFVIGGFSGKGFLKSLEYLSYDAEEFCSYLPAGSDIETIIKADGLKKKLKNGKSMRSSSNSSSTTFSDSPKSLIDEIINDSGCHTTNKNINSDSEISSTCSLEDLNKDYNFTQQLIQQGSIFRDIHGSNISEDSVLIDTSTNSATDGVNDTIL